MRLYVYHCPRRCRYITGRKGRRPKIRPACHACGAPMREAVVHTARRRRRGFWGWRG